MITRLRRLALKILVQSMRLMTRYLGFFARPFVQWYANNEVISCGLRPYNTELVSIIYTPTVKRKEHFFFQKKKKKIITAPTVKMDNFSGILVHQVQLTSPTIGDVYVVRAWQDSIINKKNVSSPNITIKTETAIKNNLLAVKCLGNGEAIFSWPQAEGYDPMIYFLTIEDQAGNSLAGIYTRENYWHYPYVRRASLALGSRDLGLFKKGDIYKAILLLVDFDGWVSHSATMEFSQEY